MSAPSHGAPKAPRRASLWRTVKAVAWGFFGVRKDSEYREDIASLTPLQIVAVGFVAVLVLIGVLVALIKFVVLP